MNDLSFEEVIQQMDFTSICKVENYLHERFDIEKSRSLRQKKENIIQCVDSLDDDEYEKLNVYVDGLLNV